MAKELDVYRDWLGIKETARPLDYYQLLRVARFEDNTAKIRTHYRKMNAHVRKFATGEYASQSQQLLNELARAMLCLTDFQRKREYDASLGRADTGEGRRRTFEEVLLANKVVDQDQLTKARNFANAVGLEIRDAVLQQKMASPDDVMLAYAESEGLPFVDLEDITIDEQLVPQIPPTLARERSCVPVMADGGQLLMASPNPLIPDVEEELRLRLGMSVRTVLCTPARINEAIAKYYPRDMPAVAPAAAPTPPPPASPQPPAADEAEAKTEAKPPPTAAEQARQRLMFAIIAFNLAVVLAMVLLKGLLGFGYPVAALAAVLLGLAAGAATWFAATYLGA